MERMTGKTTRIIDGYIQILFRNPNEWHEIYDHHPTRAMREHVMNRLKDRFEREHGSNSGKLKVNNRKCMLMWVPGEE